MLSYVYPRIIKGLCCRIQLVTTRNPVNSYLTSIVDKTHYGPCYCSFFCAAYVVFLATLGVS